MSYTVFVDDHGHYQDREHRSRGRDFARPHQAVAECKRIVRASVRSLSEPGQAAERLFELYMLYGDDPYIVASAGQDPVEFSARDYARTYCARLKRRRAVGYGFALLVCVGVLLGLAMFRGWP